VSPKRPSGSRGRTSAATGKKQSAAVSPQEARNYEHPEAKAKAAELGAMSPPFLEGAGKAEWGRSRCRRNNRARAA